MSKYPTTRLVFDRKKTAIGNKSALVQVEILYGRRKKYVSTGVKILKNQWSAKSGVCNCFEMTTLNRRIATIKSVIDDYITSLIEANAVFTFEGLERHLSKASREKVSFIEFAEERISARTDIRESTRRTEMKLIGSLKEFGRITDFSDLTRENIVAYDDFLRRKGLKQTTVWSYHKSLKTYINEAIRREIIQTSPYLTIRIKRGESEQGRWLTEEELKKVMDVELPTRSLRDVRDLFVVQCFTGLAYADLMRTDFSSPGEDNGRYYLAGDRQKTGEGYCTVLLPDVLEIIERHDGVLPKYPNQKYNMILKAVAGYAGVDKPLSSHWGRRTCGMLLLNRGVSIEVVAKVLGHSSIRTTESIYAKILNRSVIDSVSDKLSMI